MQRRFSLAVRKSTSGRLRVEPIRTTGSAPDPLVPPPPAATPPVRSQLDSVLQKAANKHSLTHPSAPPPSKEPQVLPKQPNRKGASQPRGEKRQEPRAPAGRKQQQRKQDTGADDNLLFDDKTESERDSVWQVIKLEVEGNSSDGDWADDAAGGGGGGNTPAKQRSAPSSARYDGHAAASPSAASESQPVASTSSFKGFGAPPKRLDIASPAPAATQSRGFAPPPPPPTRGGAAAPAGTSEASDAPSTAGRDSASEGPQRKRKGPLRLFLFNAEEARTRALLQQIGLAGRVDVVPELRNADAILAAKLARTGKHVNLTQGEKTAANAGIPFLVVGRNLSAENLEAALAPLLDPASAAAAAAKAAAARAPTASELHAHRMEIIHGFGQLLKAGAGSG